ncbi:MAG: DNA internalization-related competence protein ComEC/Rec2, partial [Gammaproteobacteria bacterium]|nr:DNA internalization-related competence protein ComEC/Rec2 [Gammaproteobacteria bacterium]
MPQQALAIVLGSLVALYGNELPDAYWSAYLPMLLLLVFFCPAYRLVLLFCSAFLWSSAVFHYHLEHRLVAGHDNQIALIKGTIADIPRTGQGRISLYLTDLEIEGYTGSMPRLGRLNWYQDQRIPLAGERWIFEAKLKQPIGTLNPAGFDFEAWQFSRGIDVTGYIRDSAANRKLESASVTSANYWRMRVASDIDRGCDSCKHRGLIKALSLGFRGDILPAQKRLLQSSGIAHLLAISGLHIGIVTFLFYGLGRHCWRLGFYRSGLNRAQNAWLFAMVAAVFYAALAGFSLPTVRALVMFSLLWFALQARNRINLLQSIALAVIVIFIIDPRSVGSTSFWLSFAAVLLIAFVQFRLPGRMPWWQQLLALQCCFSILFVPLGILIFNQFNPAALLANIVAIPLVSFVVLPIVLGGCLLSLAGLGGSHTLFNLADSLLVFLLDYLDRLLNSGLHSIVIYYPEPLIVMALVSMLILLLPRIARMRKVAMIALVVAVSWQAPRLKHGAYELIVLDVGMGTSVLLRTRNHNLVYDLGPGKADRLNAVDSALVPLMLRYGIHRPNLLIVSHVDQDHSGGMHSFGGYYQISNLLSGTPEELESRFDIRHPVRSCHEYPDWRWDGVDFSFLTAGTQSASASSNNRSCVLAVDGSHRVLIPGDIEASGELKLLSKYGTELDADILLAPHNTTPH